MLKKVICYGEMLWDCFPNREVPGGAPMNVALHLSQLGLSVKMISSVGNDAKGSQLLDFIRTFPVDLSLIQKDPQHPTGTVIVNDLDPQNVKYEIVSPSAWDNIQWNPGLQEAVSEADALIFGSLAARCETSRETLHHLLDTDTLKIFDINLRPPFVDMDHLKPLIEKANILKINEDELDWMAEHIGLKGSWEHIAEKVSQQFDLAMVCVTLGSKGAFIYKKGEITMHSGFKVKVKDTVGAGDAFLGGFVYGYLNEKKPKELLDFACGLGALVASKSGGTPTYHQEDIHNIIEGR
ncbi:carbohydrate kinase family protein [Pararhodonellum marinum]|uniref:carbohydrate kinase family protein n=1 Tax=Pararhodonellum marinum TaxID=2755358 RepID=UPI00188E9A74|nr:carbohydrate kinase [Pararhodonellum marinum]